MGKKKAPSLPAVPTQQNLPSKNPDIQYLSDIGHQLTGGQFTGDLGWLGDLTSLHPQNTQLALQAAQGFLQPQYAQANLDAQNMAIANNQNTSSTFTDALAKNAFNLQSQYQGIGAQAALTDAQNAMQNKMSLFGTGLNTLTSGINAAQTSENASNAFNLENYNNMVAKTLAEQKQKGGGFLGALTGGAGGLLAGAALAPFTGGASLMSMPSLIGGGLGALSGGLSPQSQNMGGSLLGAGASLMGSRIGASAPFAGSYAQNTQRAVLPQYSLFM